MKRPQRITVAAAAIILGLVWLAQTSDHEPRYNGKSLSEWLVLYGPYGPNGTKWGYSRSDEAADAVRHIGTNALPLLVTWISHGYVMPQWKVPLYQMAQRWNHGPPDRSALLRLLDPNPDLEERANRGFRILGPTARAAVPDLVRVALTGRSPGAEQATSSLMFLGIDALQPLLSLITNPTSSTARQRKAVSALGGLGYLGTNARPAVVQLIHCLSDTNLDLFAASTLGMLHLESDISVPALIECARSTNFTMRRNGILGLEQFGPSARAAVPLLTKLLEDPEEATRYNATKALKKIAPEVLEKKEAP